MIDNNILAISNVLFKDKKNWNKVTKEQKEQFFFIFNRYFSKKYLNESLLLNLKNLDKSLGMDLWYEFMSNKPYPQWFWSKSSEKKNTNEFADTELKLLEKNFNLKTNELEFLIKHHKSEIIEELEYLKKTNK